jgi:hypothetical protein
MIDFSLWKMRLVGSDQIPSGSWGGIVADEFYLDFQTLRTSLTLPYFYEFCDIIY